MGRQGKGEREVGLVQGARARPLDPSLAVMPAGVVPTGAKVGIDATIPEGIPRERYERIRYAYSDTVKLGSYKLDESAVKAADRKPRAGEVEELAARILDLIGPKPLYYAEVIDAFPGYPLQSITRTFAKPHLDEKLWHDAYGRMLLRGSLFLAKVTGARRIRSAAGYGGSSYAGLLAALFDPLTTRRSSCLTVHRD